MTANVISERPRALRFFVGEFPSTLYGAAILSPGRLWLRNQLGAGEKRLRGGRRRFSGEF